MGRKSNFEAVDDRANKLIDGLHDMGYVMHHTAWAGGYIARKPESVVVAKYETSRFNGLVVIVPSFASTKYHTRIYFVKES